MIITLILSTLLAFSPAAQESDVYQLKLILNPKESDCKMKIGVYVSQDNFLSEEVTLVSYVFDASLRDTLISIPKVVNEVAIAAYEDCNKNDLLDLNLLGIPKESYAISNNARSKWREPTFDEAKIDLETVKEISVNFEYWKNR